MKKDVKLGCREVF